MNEKYIFGLLIISGKELPSHRCQTFFIQPKSCQKFRYPETRLAKLYASLLSITAERPQTK